ncbi:MULTISPECIES: heptaprenylglyceryl phosphate synthase [unclassified Paenibacillus]|uniref:heptaprenylglyceryl phosphate synthase n=1 Tax=unclassified Paenibacillus TaxID=185978 RepID=UPI00040A73A8|nr:MULTISPECIES: heptaprenylglyceryl phosphate synthase [unclassified Paenibacillus]KKC48762.1 heptaprenylglyceryl phosphate synthase [Paenibacillus sp. D9]
MAEAFDQWRHVFKLDPDKKLAGKEMDRVLSSGTDAILVGGSSGLTYENTESLLHSMEGSGIPAVLEVSSLELAVPGFDFYLIPIALNTPDGDWITGRQAKALEEWGPLIPWERTLGEGYIILNEAAEAARVTGARTDLDENGAVAYAQLADRLMRLPIVYLEYSGRFGDMELVRRVRRSLRQARLFYGGGIDGPERAALAARTAPTVVVGNALYDHFDNGLATVRAVKETKLAP